MCNMISHSMGTCGDYLWLNYITLQIVIFVYLVVTFLLFHCNKNGSCNEWNYDNSENRCSFYEID